MDRSTNRVLLRACVALSLAAALIHATVISEHFDEWWGYGVFFVAVTAAQIAFAVVLVPFAASGRSPLPRWLPIAGITGNLALIALWVVTRSLGIPYVGPEAGEVEAVGQSDLLTKAAELVLVVVLAILLARGTSAREADRP